MVAESPALVATVYLEDDAAEGDGDDEDDECIGAPVLAVAAAAVVTVAPTPTPPILDSDDLVTSKRPRLLLLLLLLLVPSAALIEAVAAAAEWLVASLEDEEMDELAWRRVEEAVLFVPAPAASDAPNAAGAPEDVDVLVCAPPPAIPSAAFACIAVTDPLGRPLDARKDSRRVNVVDEKITELEGPEAPTACAKVRETRGSGGRMMTFSSGAAVDAAATTCRVRGAPEAPTAVDDVEEDVVVITVGEASELEADARTTIEFCRLRRYIEALRPGRCAGCAVAATTVVVVCSDDEEAGAAALVASVFSLLAWCVGDGPVTTMCTPSGDAEGDTELLVATTDALASLAESVLFLFPPPAALAAVGSACIDP